MTTLTWQRRRGELEDYFDRTAVEAWTRLTSDAPLGRIRATVRAGRDAMRATLLNWLPSDLSGCRVLDAGCGTGALAIEAARRGAHVTAVDLSATLLDLGRQRLPADLSGRVTFLPGDMLDPALGRFDHVVAMDSLIHYPASDMVRALTALAGRTHRSVVATFAPRTPPLVLMHAVGRLFPRANRAPGIQPVSPAVLRRDLAATADLAAWHPARIRRITNGFYVSEAIELVRTDTSDGTGHLPVHSAARVCA